MLLSSLLKPSVTPFHSFTGCFHRNSCLLGSRTGTIHGLIVQFSYSELHDATEKFSKSNLIGVGGSSYVYRGKLKNGKTVAIKRLKTQKGPDAVSVFLTEVITPHLEFTSPSSCLSILESNLLFLNL